MARAASSAQATRPAPAVAPAKTVAIIGAGVAGLSTGIYAQMNGYATHIFEMHSQPGGLCTSWERKGYTFDCCIHWLTGSRPGTSLYKLWQEIGLIQDLTLVDHDELVRVEFPAGPTVHIYTDLDRLEKHLLEIAPEDAAVIKEFAADGRWLAAHELPSDLPPRQLMGLGTILRIMPRMLRIMPLLRKWDKMTIAQFVGRIKNPYVREAFSQVWMPEMSAFILVTTLAWFHGRQAGYPIGGSLPLAKTMEQRFVDLGGAIDYRVRVSEILVENDRAVGVRLTDGREERFDVVISAADGHATVFDILKGRYADDRVRGWFTELTPFPALVFVSLGVDRDFSGEPPVLSGVSVALDEPFKVDKQTIERLNFRIHSYDPTLAPAGKTAITCMFGGDYEYWTDLAQDRAAYEAQKKAIAAAVVKALDRRWPGSADQVEVADVATPATFVRYTGNWRGSFEGWLPTPGDITRDMGKTLPGLGCFYMVGQWVAIGGGLPSGLMTGRQVVQLMCHKDGRRFQVPAS
jgi:phytoene dehydrogenase-like protein